MIIATVVILLRKLNFSRNKSEEKNDEKNIEAKREGTTNNLSKINTPTPHTNDLKNKVDNSSFSQEDLDEDNI